MSDTVWIVTHHWHYEAGEVEKVFLGGVDVRNYIIGQLDQNAHRYTEKDWGSFTSWEGGTDSYRMQEWTVEE